MIFMSILGQGEGMLNDKFTLIAKVHSAALNTSPKLCPLRCWFFRFHIDNGSINHNQPRSTVPQLRVALEQTLKALVDLLFVSSTNGYLMSLLQTLSDGAY